METERNVMNSEQVHQVNGKALNRSEEIRLGRKSFTEEMWRRNLAFREAYALANQGTSLPKIKERLEESELRLSSNHLREIKEAIEGTSRFSIKPPLYVSPEKRKNFPIPRACSWCRKTFPSIERIAQKTVREIGRYF